MRARTFLILLATLCLAGAGFAKKKRPRENNGFVYDLHLGVAEVRDHGQICVTVKNPKLSPGDPVSIITTDGSVQQGRISSKLEKSCSRDTHVEADDTFYSVQLNKSDLSAGTLGLAITDYTGPFQQAPDAVAFNTLRLEGKPDYFSDCTSSEGVHLLVWNGPPHQGPLQWHRYYYLGYDVDSNCSDADTTAMQKLKD